MQIPAWAPRVAIAAALVLLVGWSFAARWEVLSATPYPLGVDGFFYPIEVRSLLEHGTLAYPASPLTFYWMAPFAAATDPIVGAKLGAALGGALIAVPAYGLGARLGHSRLAGLACAIVATTSAGSAYLSIEFVKQGIGMTVALAALWAALRALERPSRPRVAGAAIAIAAAVLAHKLAGALVIAMIGIAAIENARARGALRGRRLLYVLVAVVAGVIALGLFAPQRFVALGDVSLVRDLFSSTARWTTPALVTPVVTLDFDHEAGLAALAALIAIPLLLVGRLAHRREERVLAWGFIALALVVGGPWLAVGDPQGLGFRLRIAAFVPFAACAAIVVGALPLGVRAGVLALVVAAALLVPRTRHEGQVLAAPALVQASQALADHVPPGATIIASERHVEFMIAWYTRAPVSLRPEAVPYLSRARVLLARSPATASFSLTAALQAARDQTLLPAPLSLHPGHRDGFVLVTEPTWDFILTRLPPRSRAFWQAWPNI